MLHIAMAQIREKNWAIYSSNGLRLNPIASLHSAKKKKMLRCKCTSGSFSQKHSKISSKCDSESEEGTATAPMNPSAPSSTANLSTTLSSLTNLLQLSNQILPISPSPQTLTANLIQCPFNSHHLMPPHALFHHHLRCPSAPRPLPDLNHLFHSLSYPNSLHHSPSDQLSFYLNPSSKFFYRDSPGVVTFSDANSVTGTVTLPSVLSLECADSELKDPNPEIGTSTAVILPSEYVSITRELQSWNDYPTNYSVSVLRAVLGIGVAKECDLKNWIIANSPRYGVVINIAMQEHIFLLCCLCLKSILREASVSAVKQNLQLDCPVLNQALAWLASQVSILYGANNGRFFVLDFVKKCVLVGASGLLLFPLEGEVAASKQECQSSDTGGGVEEAKSDAEHEKKKSMQSRKIFASQVAAAVAALHERSLLEHEIKRFWFSQRPSNYQLFAEHGYLSEKANEERRKRLDYRPLIDHDVLHPQHQSYNQDSSRAKTREELLAEERDYKRRRMSYRGKKRNQTTLQVMRDMIEEYMEEIKHAGGIESPTKVSEEGGMFPPKPPSGHDIPTEASHDSSAVTISNPNNYEQQSCTNNFDKSKDIEDASSRDYEKGRQGHYRNHYYEDQRDIDRDKYRRGHASESPERHICHSRSHEHRIHHKKESDRKKYDNSSRTRDRWQKDELRNRISDSSVNNAFSDRYNPYESRDVYDDDISSDAKYTKPDKIYNKEVH